MTKAMAAEGIRVRYLDMCGMTEETTHSQNTVTEEDLRRVADATAETLIHLAESMDAGLEEVADAGIDFPAFALGTGFGMVVMLGIMTVLSMLL